MTSFRPDISKAAAIIRSGGLVAFPTETVYGLGADATDGDAVAEIFQLKGRPQFNPLIVHVLNLDDAAKYVDVTDEARKLAEKFWPGPLTFVLKRKKNAGLSYLVSAGLDTVAVRCPLNLIARELLTATGKPIAAPSANRSGTISPTSASDVRNSFGPDAPFILDGGKCSVGVESTILNLSLKTPFLLRHGGIPKEEIEEFLGKSVPFASPKAPDAPMSPGQLLSHYAPALPVRMNTRPKSGEAFLGFGNAPDATLNLSETGDLKEAAANLFSMLRALDDKKYAGIAVAPIPSFGLGAAINDRLTRASYPR